VSGSVAPLLPIRDIELPDVQAEPPAIVLQLDEAGVSGLRYPITVHLSDGSQQATVASVAFAASVAAETRGVHMSRFVESLHVWRNRIGVSTLTALLGEIRERLDAGSAVARFDFPLFLERTGPVSGGVALVPYDCSLEGQIALAGAHCTLTARVPVTSLCPCSREISDYGAHNQRGTVEIKVSFNLTTDGEHVDFSDLVEVAESAGSAPIYTLLKRSDERYITMRAYENPAFVEDIARAVAAALTQDPRIASGRVRVVNEESIHSHDAFATLAWTR
jgi:GTP cyclohydrolase FolE2